MGCIQTLLDIRDWKGFYDAPHFEMTGGLNVKVFLQNGKRSVFMDVPVKSGATKQAEGKSAKPKAPVKTVSGKSVSLPSEYIKKATKEKKLNKFKKR